VSSESGYYPPSSGPLSKLTRPVAALRLNPITLSERLGLRFFEGFDDLDFLDWAEVGGRRGRYALVYHRNAPRPLTQVVISSASQDPRREFEDVLETMQLTHADVAWMDPEIFPKRVARSHHVRPAKSTSVGRSSSRVAAAKTRSGSRVTAKHRSSRSARTLTASRTARAARKK
jgi:hypothetical protein